MIDTVTRSRVEDVIEKLLSFLDEIDGDPDFELEFDEEDGSDAEPSLGASSAIDQISAWRHAGSTTDLEDEHDGREEEYHD